MAEGSFKNLFYSFHCLQLGILKGDLFSLPVHVTLMPLWRIAASPWQGDIYSQVKREEKKRRTVHSERKGFCCSPVSQPSLSAWCYTHFADSPRRESLFSRGILLGVHYPTSTNYSCYRNSCFVNLCASLLKRLHATAHFLLQPDVYLHQTLDKSMQCMASYNLIHGSTLCYSTNIKSLICT